MFETVIRGGLVILPHGPGRVDLGIGADGTFHAIASPSELEGKRIIDADGLVVLPGGIDPHVHIKMEFSKIQKTIDDFYTATVPAAMGGTTSIVEFAIPMEGETTQQALSRRYEEAAGMSVIDYNFHSVVVGHTFAESLAHLEHVREQGIGTVKVFSAYSDSIGLTLGQIQTVMRICNQQGLLPLVHSETESLILRGIADQVERNNLVPHAHLEARTTLAEADAIRSICDMAADADVPVFIVHVSSADGSAIIHERRQQGQKVYAETCTQYLFLDDSVFYRPHGELWICSPPIRTKEHQKALWKEIQRGTFDLVSTDHNSFTREQKALHSDDFRKVPNGLPGLEFRMPILISAVLEGRLTWQQLAQLTAEGPARVFGMLPHKGIIGVGYDADFLLVDPAGETDLSIGHMATDYSPYEGIARGRIQQTWVRGTCLINDGELQVEKGYGAKLGFNCGL
jgi:dihydropyrimidinase